MSEEQKQENEQVRDDEVAPFSIGSKKRLLILIGVLAAATIIGIGIYYGFIYEKLRNDAPVLIPIGSPNLYHFGPQ